MTHPDLQLEQIRKEYKISSRDEGADWFSAQLFRLIHKADRGNLELLRMEFPLHVQVVEEVRGY